MEKDKDRPELTIKLGGIQFMGGTERLEEMKAELPSQAAQIIDMMAEKLLENPHKIVEALATSLQFATTQLSELTGKSPAEIGANLMQRVGESIGMDNDMMQALFALAMIEAVVRFYEAGAKKVEERQAARKKASDKSHEEAHDEA